MLKRAGGKFGYRTNRNQPCKGRAGGSFADRRKITRIAAGAGKYLSEGNTKTEHSQKKEQPQEIFGSGFPIGGFFVPLAVIGLITVITFGVRATENLIDNSKQKKEFENIILPVLMFDPVPFDDPNEMGDLALRKFPLSGLPSSKITRSILSATATWWQYRRATSMLPVQSCLDLRSP